ncbi:MAG: hypothetical protein KatS3mg126_0726 [Lysobacteraceae bacterium]|nr:MAG: hypothetical protein KatS3mg126_0726 [Xanthomonadaceae bacterium]
MARRRTSGNPGPERSPPGLERRLLRAWRWFVLGGLLGPAMVAAVIALAGHDAGTAEAHKRQLLAWFALAGWTAVYWLAVLAVLAGAWVVRIMKGPERRADALPLPQRDRLRA